MKVPCLYQSLFFDTELLMITRFKIVFLVNVELVLNMAWFVVYTFFSVLNFSIFSKF